MKLLTWSAIGFFLILLGLMTAGIYIGPSDNSPFLQPFFSLANILAAVCAGIMTSELSGFLSVELEKRFKKKGTLAIKAGGGFAVFLLVLALNPKAKMFSAADAVFATLSQSCSHAVANPVDRPDAHGICSELAHKYPKRPEAFYQLGIFYGRYDRSPEGMASAVENLKKSAKHLGITKNESINIAENQKLRPGHRSMAIDTMTRLVVVQSEVELLNNYERCEDESDLDTLVDPFFFYLKRSPNYILEKHRFKQRA